MTIIKENSTSKLGTMPIGKLIADMSIPLMISMLMQAGYDLADSIFVARLNENALTAVTLAFPVQVIMIGLAIGTSIGVGAIVSRRFGEGNDKEASRVAQTGIVLAFITWIIVALMVFFMTNIFVGSQTSDADIIKYAKDYIYIVGIGGIGVFMQIMFERMLQATGKSTLSMVTQIAGVVVNIILDPILIYGLFSFPRLEAAGAAIATVMGQLVGMAVGFYLNLNKNKELNYRLKGFKIKFEIIKDIYTIGVPSIFIQILGSIMIFCYNRILISITSTAVAVFGAYFRLNGFVFMPVFAMNSALTPIISYNFGSKNANRIKQALKQGIIIAVIIMTFGTLLFQIMPNVLLLMFKPSDKFLEIGIPALRIISVIFPMAGFSIVMSSLFQSVGRAYYSLIVTLTRQILVLLPAGYLLSRVFKLNGVWWGFLIAEVIALFLVIIFYKEIDRNILKKL